MAGSTDPLRRRSARPSGRGWVTPYERLKRAIIEGEFGPGEQLVETALAEWCKVSRTPIREALSRLEQDGLVERSDRGLIVPRRSAEEILDIYETRIVLEASAARTAAERRSEYDVRALRRLIERSDPVTSDDDSKVDLNRQVHRAVWHASHNEPLKDLLARLDAHLARYPATTLSYPDRWEEAKSEHIAIIDAIAARDAAQAHEVTLAHFRRARDIRLQMWEDGDT